MGMIRVCNKNHKHNQMLGNEFYIGRGSALGNKFTHLPLERTMAEFQAESRTDAIEKYQVWLDEKIKNKDEKVIEALNQIIDLAKTENVNLMCYCKPMHCHGDYIKKLVDKKIKKGERF